MWHVNHDALQLDTLHTLFSLSFSMSYTDDIYKMLSAIAWILSDSEFCLRWCVATATAECVITLGTLFTVKYIFIMSKNFKWMEVFCV